MWSQSPLLFNYDIKTGLPSNTVYYVMQDSNGFLWYGTDSGVSRYDGNEIVTFTPQDGLSDNEILQIKEDSQNRIWFLPFNGRISYFKDGVFYNGTTNPTLKSLYVKDIYSCFFEDSQQRIWLGSRISGIKILKPDNETVHIDFLPGTIYQVWEDED